MDNTTKRHQGAIPKQSRPKPTASDAADDSIVPSEEQPRGNLKRYIQVRRQRTRRRDTKLEQTSGSNNELSTLLPSPASPLLAALLNNSGRDLPGQSNTTSSDLRLSRNSEKRTFRARYGRLKRQPNIVYRARSRNNASRDDNVVPLTALFGLISSGECHLATNQNDTSEGAVHYFRDDNGHWLAYTFDEKGLDVTAAAAAATATQIPANPHNEKLLNTLLRQQLNQNIHYDATWELAESLSNSYSSLSLNSAGLTVIIDTPPVLSSPASNQTKTQSSPPSNLISSNTGSSNQCTLGENSEREQFHHTLIPHSDSMADRNRRLQNLLGNLNLNQYHSDFGRMPVLTLPTQEPDINTSLSWNRFVDGLDGSDSKPTRTRHYYKWKIGKLPHINTLRSSRLASSARS